MPDYGLALLSGLLGSAPEFNKGWDVAVKQKQAEDQLAEQQRQADQLTQHRNTLETLQRAGLDLQQRAQTRLEDQAAWQQAEAQRKEALAQQQRGELASTVEGLAVGTPEAGIPGDKRFEGVGPLMRQPGGEKLLPLLKAPKAPDAGTRREAMIAEYLSPTTTPERKAYLKQTIDLLMPTVILPDTGAFGKTSLIPNGPSQPGTAPTGPPQPAIKADKPVSAEAATQVAGAARVRDAIGRIQQAIQDPTVRNYIGPYAQYHSLVQSKAPFEAAGKVPTAVVDLEQGLNELTNYTIKLITGAQMSEQEAARLKAQLPRQSDQYDVFVQRLGNTLATAQNMEKRIRELALSGNQRARLAAQEMGLEIPNAPAQTAPAAQGVVRWGRDAQGRPVRLQ